MTGFEAVCLILGMLSGVVSLFVVDHWPRSWPLPPFLAFIGPSVFFTAMAVGSLIRRIMCR